ncbi:class I SAM-dependent methyltransferase [Spirillospora sp. NPDC048911]|uniref:class I SAM-dependent methyltransferase n=1 Tax=Spirillospora sp. NPDC048911 TaxID=3364527 RepID=UPI00371B2AC4
MDFDAFERSSWEGRAEAYERGFALMTAHLVEPLLNSAAVGPRTRLLDVGCGPGPVTAAALALGARVTSVDADLDMAELVARRHPHTEVRVAVLPDLPFPDESFDAVIGNFVVNHTGDPAAAARELHRVLRPGGTIALTCWKYPEHRAGAVFSEALRSAGADHPADVPTESPFSAYAEPTPFARLLAEAGFEGAAADTLRWTHRVDPGVWWADVLAGTALTGTVIARQGPATIDRIRAEYDRIVAGYATPDGRVALPACALLAHAVR